MSNMRIERVREELREAMACVSTSSKYESDTRADSLSLALLGSTVGKGLNYLLNFEPTWWNSFFSLSPSTLVSPPPAHQTTK